MTLRVIFKVPAPKVSFAARTTKAPQHLYDPGGLPERPMGGDCKSPGSAFEGSNPSPATGKVTWIQYQTLDLRRSL